MISKTLIIYEYQILYEILSEIKEHLNFKILYVDRNKYKELKLDKIENYLIISPKKSQNIKSNLILENLPLKLEKLIQIININFLRTNFLKKSEINVGKYKLDLNSREIILNKLSLGLTEKETEIIIFIKSNELVTIKELQNNVWGYSSNLETHTVETHIYRLRKKMKDKFGDSEFIQNSQKGYKIN
tara:strand:- start:515 stop:1075 length:561 start_codon:yes stop_codon:yes gene_type:complete